MVARQRHVPLAEQATPGLDHVVVVATAVAAAPFFVLGRVYWEVLQGVPATRI